MCKVLFPDEAIVPPPGHCGKQNNSKTLGGFGPSAVRIILLTACRFLRVATILGEVQVPGRRT